MATAAVCAVHSMKPLPNYFDLLYALHNAMWYVDLSVISQFDLSVFCILMLQCWADQEGRKALSKNNARGLTTLKQRCKKYIRDYKLDTKLADYRLVC